MSVAVNATLPVSFRDFAESDCANSRAANIMVHICPNRFIAHSFIFEKADCGFDFPVAARLVVHVFRTDHHAGRTAPVEVQRIDASKTFQDHGQFGQGCTATGRNPSVTNEKDHPAVSCPAYGRSVRSNCRTEYVVRYDLIIVEIILSSFSRFREIERTLAVFQQDGTCTDSITGIPYRMNRRIDGRDYAVLRFTFDGGKRTFEEIVCSVCRSGPVNGRFSEASTPKIPRVT